MGKDPYIYFRVEGRELLDGLAQAVLSLEKDGVAKELIGRMLRMAHTLKGAARVVKQAEISEAAHDVEDILARYRDGEGQLTSEEIGRLLQLIDQCGERLNLLASPRQEVVESLSVNEKETPIDSVRIDILQLDATLYDVVEAETHLDALSQQTPLLEQMRVVTKRLVQRTALRQNGRADRGLSTSATAALSSLAVELQTITDRLHVAFRTGLERLERDLTRIRDRAGEFRLLPASTIQPALERSARDVSTALRRRVAFEMIGGEQRLDAHILLGLRDALIHAVRNAVVHGIETESERAAAGKALMGRVTVRITRIGQQIAFRVEDDGRGLDIAAIRAAAVARGLTPTTPTVMGIAEAAQILFRGGVSTSPSVSEFSGRGVGLDIVRAAAQRLKGTASLHSDRGQGTTVEISVPLSIESISALAVAVGDVTLLIPAGAVSRAARVCSGDLVDSPSGASLLVAEQAIPFRPLSDILDLKTQIGSAARPWSVVVVQADGSQVAIGVDRLKEIRNVVVRPLPAACCAISLVAGATLNGMGNPELVLDPGRLVAAVLATPGPKTQTTPVAQQTVLVVDDSLTTRMLEQSILEAAGFCVDLATSGEEALIKARNQSHSLFIVDVEMPGMNGFELLHRFREDPALQGTPAIMVSSRNSADDRRCADQAGARDYIVKSEFDESRLLRTIRGLLREVSQ